METVIGVEPTVAELQSGAFPLGYTVMISAERLELSLTASETVVLPVRRNGNMFSDSGGDRTRIADVTDR